MMPSVRPQIYDTYWKFAGERHAILLRRLAGETPPWTDDPVLGAYKFCNTYRAADRITQYIIRTGPPRPRTQGSSVKESANVVAFAVRLCGLVQKFENIGILTQTDETARYGREFSYQDYLKLFA
jgi:hypothetical protein